MPNAVPDEALIERFGQDLARLHTEAREGNERFGVALSGGPDSCALLLLTAAILPGRTLAMTVDHGLRAGAAEEAEQAGALCSSIGVPHQIARVSVTEDGRGLQAAAREARYTALAEWAELEGLAAILTAHHADDQAETLLMRLGRGAGLSGLAGVRAARPLRHSDDGPILLRPLLGWRKAELEAIVAAAGIIPARDPSNDDLRFDRTAARRLLADADWLDPRRVACSAAWLAEAETTLTAIAGEQYAERIVVDTTGVMLRPSPHPEINRRLVVRLFAERFAKSPDGPAIERTFASLERGKTVTLADILCRAEGGLWHFRPAPPRSRPARSS